VNNIKNHHLVKADALGVKGQVGGSLKVAPYYTLNQVLEQRQTKLTTKRQTRMTTATMMLKTATMVTTTSKAKNEEKKTDEMQI
jgi:hypothetical protein